MSRMKGFLRTKYVLLLGMLLFVVLGMPQTVMAAGTGSITFTYQQENVKFRIYKVGEIDSDGASVLTGEFVNYNVDLTDKNAAQTLEALLGNDSSIVYLEEKATDTNKQVKFENLENDNDIYLICGDSLKVGYDKYIPVPVLVTLPTESEGDFYNDIEVKDKCEIKDVSPKDISIVIIWKDQGLENMRPPEITVQLKKDGEVVEEVVLNEENNWTHEWKDLDGEHEWTVEEKEIPPEYGVSIRKEGDTYIVEHDRAPEPETPPASTPTETPPSGTTTVPPSSTVPGQLPQTGQLWWPVFALIFGGLLFMVVGLLFKRTERE